jgi:GMP synthase-like glutamine amidotransferase
MKTGLLLCDHVRDELQPDHGDYPDMFRALLPELDLEVFAVCDGQFPGSPHSCDAWLATGSKFSVYDEVDWIVRLKAFVRDINGSGKPYAGVCFGHQLLGEALGGKVRKSERGWCLGVHEFTVLQKENWMMPFTQKLNVLMSCQDQVEVLPENSTVLASSANCPVAMFRVGERMLGIQGHPEFSKAYNRALMENRAEQLGNEVVQKGLESLKNPAHRDEIAAWIVRFLLSCQGMEVPAALSSVTTL